MSRDELNASELAELAALDHILAREPVGEEHLELAALVDSVRAGAPRMDAACGAQLDAQIASALERSAARRLRVARPALRRLAVASGAVVAAAVALTIVISGGLLDGAASRTAPFSAPTRSTPQGQGQKFQPSIAPESKAPAVPSGANSGAGAPALGASAAPSGSAPLHAAPAVGAAPGANSAGRLVHRDSTMTLASSPATMQALANQIIAATEQQGGVVESSDVNIQGAASYASFSLQVPSGRLAPLIAALSSLASVRALSQSTTDITGAYSQETARLADSLAERAALLRKLATAATSADAASFQHQIDALGHRIAAQHRAIDTLLNQGHTARLQVNVMPGPSIKHTVVVGPLTRAFHEALHALQEILAIALIALAIALPFALCALALWWSAASVRQRARERAMKTT